MSVLGIRQWLAIASVLFMALFGANLVVHAWAGAKRDTALARLRSAVGRRAAVVSLQHDLADRWREADVLQHVTLTDDQRGALTERFNALAEDVSQLVRDAPPSQRADTLELADAVTPIVDAWMAHYAGLTAPRSAARVRALPRPDDATRHLAALSTVNDRVAAEAVDELSEVTAVTDRISVAMFLVTLCSATVGMVALWRRLTRAVHVLADGAQRLGRGELDHRIALARRDEFGYLAQAFNGMAASVAHAHAAAEAARDVAEHASATRLRFLTNVTHDFRTPLTAILGYAELIRDDAAQGGLPGVAADASHIEAAGKHLLGLVNDLLDAAKADAGRMPLHIDAFDVRDLVDDVVASLGVLAGQGGNRLDILVEPGIGAMTSDAMKLRQSLFNLVGNAVKFTDHGVITLRATRVSRGDIPWVQFAVSDTGIGIPPERLETVFDEFEQVDGAVARTYGGSGLGLAIARRFCRLLGGDIAVASQPGVGTTFTIDVPASIRVSDDAPALELVEGGFNTQTQRLVG